MIFSTEHERDADDPLARLVLGYAGSGPPAEPHLSVDGMTPTGPNLSHWPGNRTPSAFRADLSTGIALRFAAAPASEQEAFLGDVRLIVNDHYDTDGFGALLAILRPELAKAHEEQLLAAASVGDFAHWQTWRAFAIDRIVKNLALPASPVAAAFRDCRDDHELTLARYRWLIERAESVLAHPGGYRALYEDELASVTAELDAGRRGALDVRHLRWLGCSVVQSDGPRHRMTLNTLAGAYRVLHVERRGNARCYRYHDRTESWFDLVTIQPPRRTDLRPLARRLAELEPDHDGARWQADPPDVPIPELYFGVPAAQEYGEVTRELRESKLDVDRVTAELVAHFEATTDRS